MHKSYSGNGDEGYVMTNREFDSLATEMFGIALIPLGFSSMGSERCTFYRRAGNDVYHFIRPDIGSRGTWYDVRVFPHSPKICPLFERRFPDDLGVPTDRFSFLSEQEIGITQSQFNCKDDDNFRRRFTATVGPALLRVAIPYLDRFQAVADIIPAIRHPSFLPFALHHVGRHDEAFAALRRERDRLRSLNSSTKEVVMLLEEVERLLQYQA